MIPQTMPTPDRAHGDTLREARPGLSQLHPAPSPAGSLLKLCAWCQDIWGTDGYRRQTEQDRQLVAATPREQISHGLCPVCEAVEHTKLLQLQTHKETT